jgi:glycerol-3-phosphate dehydrogenase
VLDIINQDHMNPIELCSNHLCCCFCLQGRSVLDIINQDHMNPIELPGVHLGDNLVASSNLEEVIYIKFKVKGSLVAFAN